jgi:pimeloyl-ACP methyl ester carboxylesterase
MRLRLSFGFLCLFALLTGSLFPAAAQTWKDSSPHQSRFVRANGVRLHYLDWGGQGQTLLFLSDIGFTAHSFDDLAPRFTDRFRVLALTRRGHGRSEKSLSGYDRETLTDDLRLFLDQLNLRSVILAGHGVAGAEMVRFANRYPERVTRLVFLDAAYDTLDAAEVNVKYAEAWQNLAPPPFPLQDTRNFDAARQWAKQQFGCWSEAFEAELRETLLIGSMGRLVEQLPATARAQAQRALMIGVDELRRLRIPMLAFFALDSVESVFPWLPANASPAQRELARKFVEAGNAYKQKQITRFRLGIGERRAIEMPDTSHFCFIARREEIAREMRAFLAK